MGKGRVIVTIPQVGGGLRVLMAQDHRHAVQAREVIRRDPATVERIADMVDGLILTIEDRDPPKKRKVHDVLFEAATDVGSIGFRLHPLDVGWDLRAEGCAVELKPHPDGRDIRVSYADRDGERRVCEGSIEAVAAHLVRHGYTVRK